MKKYPVTPSARKLIAVPLTIWSARSWIDTNAWINAINPPATIAQRMPSDQLPNLSAPSTAKNAPVNIIPSSPMFTTPLRSQNIPPRAAYVSGVANTNIAVKSGVHETT